MAGHFIRCEFNPALKRVKLRRVPFHSLRNSYATMLSKSGAHPKYIQEQMGHSSIKVTMDLCGHMMNDTNPGAAKALQDAFLGKVLTIRGQARRARPEGPLQMIDLFGGGYRDRTGDLVIANHALSQLS